MLRTSGQAVSVNRKHIRRAALGTETPPVSINCLPDRETSIQSTVRIQARHANETPWKLVSRASETKGVLLAYIKSDLLFHIQHGGCVISANASSYPLRRFWRRPDCAPPLVAPRLADGENLRYDLSISAARLKNRTCFKLQKYEI